MVRSHREVSRRLYEIAETQQGFFTTKQAKDAGYRENTHTYHAKVGNWVREHRGIYRLAQFPPAQQADLVRWALWSRNRRQEIEGVYSHLTALGLCGFSEINPSQLHMTVPTHFRRNSKIPDILILHFADLPESDVETARGFRFTCPQRTILDLVEALRQGLQGGRITPEQIESACVSGPARKLCARILRAV
jgi:predicted transcriptional regulator of viral defense system